MNVDKMASSTAELFEHNRPNLQGFGEGIKASAQAGDKSVSNYVEKLVKSDWKGTRKRRAKIADFLLTSY
jgi:hypothetical protein